MHAVVHSIVRAVVLGLLRELQGAVVSSLFFFSALMDAVLRPMAALSVFSILGTSRATIERERRLEGMETSLAAARTPFATISNQHPAC